jgi:CMP-N-acetylneuraminic acid synthetase
MIHAAQWCEDHIERPDYIFLLQPTSPTRTSADINIVIEIMKGLRSQGYVHFGPDGKPSGLLYATSWDLLMNDPVVWNGFSTTCRSMHEIIDIDTEEDWKKAERALCK